MESQTEAAAAGKKAFIVTRIGDMGFFIGIPLAFKVTGTLDFYTEAENGILQQNDLNSQMAFGFKAATVISFLLFVGAVGKSGKYRFTFGCRMPWRGRRLSVP